MPYEPTLPSTTPPTRYGDPILYPTAVQQRVMPLAELPPGVQLVTLPNGIRTLAYTPPAGPLPAPVQPIPAWAKTTALLAPTLGAGIAAAGFGIAYAAPGLIAMTDALWAAIALIAAGVLAPALLRTTRRAGQATAPVQHITQNISAPGLFGRATGTFNNR
ncbi:hypothetical protein [Streptomyces sp. XY332]|uniref:hypothetical protein n=1 Tax=Streptomyces sp. XY332 TaxID=1415561 RepID=UPI0003C95FFD|nr:hypothetical protein [Streptomyces sp. XY332]AGZ93746.1 hypothetical protein [Streptomyces sp. XY332]